MVSMWFNRGKKFGDNELATSTLKLALILSSSTIDNDPDVDNVAGLAAGWELTAMSGYARATLASVTSTIDDTNNRAVLDAADVNFPSIVSPSGTVGGVLIILQVDGTDANDVPLCILPWGSAQTISGSFDVAFPASGIAFTN